jgi:uncharacterized protein YecE (DUF72 family)
MIWRARIAAVEPSAEALRLQRRARREARRAAQRLQNVDRAKRMHAARLAFVAHPAGRLRVPPPRDRIHVGCSGWYYWHWKGCFYPPDLPGKDWFNHYASTFDTAELNAPFYSWPTVATVKNWLRQAAGHPFIYTVKVNEMITHTKRFVGTRTLVKDFYHIADLLGERMGCFLFQLPPSVKYSAAMLKRIVQQLDPAHRNVVEFRHKSWWNDRVYAAFQEAGIIFCSCSGPRLPDELIQTADDVYLRFHGTTRWYRHNYTPDELAVWVQRLKKQKPRRIWAYFNNDRDGYAIANAQDLNRQLSADIDLRSAGRDATKEQAGRNRTKASGTFTATIGSPDAIDRPGTSQRLGRAKHRTG